MRCLTVEPPILKIVPHGRSNLRDVNRSGDISLFKVTGEFAVAGGVRRIEAVTSRGAMDWFNSKISTLETAANALKAPADQLTERIEVLLAERKKAEATISALRKTWQKAAVAPITASPSAK